MLRNRLSEHHDNHGNLKYSPNHQVNKALNWGPTFLQKYNWSKKGERKIIFCFAIQCKVFCMKFFQLFPQKDF